jgi:hypothetical protein
MEGRCTVPRMNFRPADEPTTPDDATQLGLAVIAEAAALNSRDDKIAQSAADNLQDTVDGLVDEPMTARQEEVVESLGAVAGSLLAGVSGALAAQQDLPVEQVLERTARVVLSKRQLTTDNEPDQRDL